VEKDEVVTVVTIQSIYRRKKFITMLQFTGVDINK